MSTRTQQKVAIITGASRGIGEALVAGYRKRGWAVVANSRTIDPSSDPDLVTVAGDISEVADEVVDTAINRFGRIDTLVNNAGVFVAKPFTDHTPADFEHVVKTNLGGFFPLTQRTVARMLEQGTGGHIVQVTTSLVDHPNSNVPSVLASLTKGGLQAATKSLAIEYAARGVRVNAVSPGIIETPMHAPETHAALATLHPVGHIGETSDIVQAVLFLEDAAFVTGEILHVDGGQSAGH